MEESGPFKGKGVRLDGRDIKNKPAKKEKVYDPREHKIPHGIRREWFINKNF